MQRFLGIMCFGAMVYLSGCAEKVQTSSPKITIPEFLGMRLDITTKNQVVDILNARGYKKVIEQKEISGPMLTYSGLRDISKPNK